MDWNAIFTYEILRDSGISIGIFLLFLIFRKVFSKYVYTLIVKLSNKAPTGFFSVLFGAFEKPIQWLFLVIGFYMAIDYHPYFDRSNELFLHIIRSLVILLISWGLFNLSSSSTLFFAKVNEKYNLHIDEILIPFLSKALRFVIFAITLSIIAQEFNYDVNGFIAGLGLGGLAFALAAKDTLGNLFGGVVIITDKPFTIGDWIKTPSVEGIVETITFRSTKVRTFDQALVTVPNATLANEPITNGSEMGMRRINFSLQLTHNTESRKVQDVVSQIRYVLKNHKGIHSETVLVVFNEYKESGLGILFNFFTNTTDYPEHMAIREEINFEILAILENEGVELAIPRRRLYINSADEDVREQVEGTEEKS